MGKEKKKHKHKHKHDKCVARVAHGVGRADAPPVAGRSASVTLPAAAAATATAAASPAAWSASAPRRSVWCAEPRVCAGCAQRADARVSFSAGQEAERAAEAQRRGGGLHQRVQPLRRHQPDGAVRASPAQRARLWSRAPCFVALTRPAALQLRVAQEAGEADHRRRGRARAGPESRAAAPERAPGASQPTLSAVAAPPDATPVPPRPRSRR